jgi:uncharacterized protein (DUF1778 family)
MQALKTTRLNIRIPENLKGKVKKAALLSGHKNMTNYVVSVLNEISSEATHQRESFASEEDIFDRFMETCDNTKAT